ATPCASRARRLPGSAQSGGTVRSMTVAALMLLHTAKDAVAHRQRCCCTPPNLFATASEPRQSWSGPRLPACPTARACLHHSWAEGGNLRRSCQNVNVVASCTIRWPCFVVTVPNCGVFTSPVVPLKPRFRFAPLNDHSG